MSSFCWCILKIEKSYKQHFIYEYKRNNICCIFDKENNRFLSKSLAVDEVFCNIACGYDSVPYLSRTRMLNNDGMFFGYAYQKKLNDDVFKIAQNELKKRLEIFQDTIYDIYNIEGVRSLKLYFTETAQELSLSEYVLKYWKINEIAIKTYELLENNHGLLPAFTLEWKKNTQTH